MKLNNLFYSNKRSNYIVNVAQPNIQSIASYILLKRHYLNIQRNSYGSISKLPYSVRAWLTFRNKFFRRLKKSGKLSCYYCNKINLTPNHNNPNIQKFDGRATIDHYQPLAKNGDKYNEKNFRCSCSKCNSLKGSLTPKEFFHKYKNILFGDFFKDFIKN